MNKGTKVFVKSRGREGTVIGRGPDSWDRTVFMPGFEGHSGHGGPDYPYPPETNGQLWYVCEWDMEVLDALPSAE